MTKVQGDFLMHNNDVYLKIWEIEKAHERHRWTITTFFIGISFALFGFTFKEELTSSISTATRITSLVIYWFAYLLFQRFYNYTKVLRDYLRKMESEDSISIKIISYQEFKNNPDKADFLAANKLLLYFGYLFTLVVLLIALSGFYRW